VLIVGINTDYLESPSSEPAALDPKSVIAATAVKQGWLPEATHNAPDLVDLLSDLAGGRGRKEGVDVTYWSEPKSPIQVWLRTKGGKLLGKGDLLTEQEYSNHKPKVVKSIQTIRPRNSRSVCFRNVGVKAGHRSQPLRLRTTTFTFLNLVP
jgi:hypothetical protein